MKEEITYDIFDKVDIRVGTVISVKKNAIPGEDIVIACQRINFMNFYIS